MNARKTQREQHAHLPEREREHDDAADDDGRRRTPAWLSRARLKGNLVGARRPANMSTGGGPEVPRTLGYRQSGEEARLQPPAICWILPIRVPAMKLGSQFVSTTRCGQVARRLKAGADAYGAAGVAEDAGAVPAERVRLPGQRDTCARRAAGADPDAVPVVPDGFRTGAGVGPARPGDDGHRRAHPAVEHRVDRDEGEVVADAVVVADRDVADLDEHRVRGPGRERHEHDRVAGVRAVAGRADRIRVTAPEDEVHRAAGGREHPRAGPDADLARERGVRGRCDRNSRGGVHPCGQRRRVPRGRGCLERDRPSAGVRDGAGGVPQVGRGRGGPAG